MNNLLLKRFLALLLAIAAFSCAGQVAPSGGPVDRTPPEILETLPAAGALNVRKAEITLNFSKYVERRTLEESVFFSPSLGQLTFDWGGKSVTIRSEDSLRAATTYIMTVGTDLRDTHANTMAKSFALPFSTGESIDSCSITGRVVDEKPTGVMVFAYRLDGRRADTLNPSVTKPDYLTQTGKDGSFQLGYLATGTYRLLAIRDELKNLLYDLQQDGYGMAASDVGLTASAPSAGGVQFRLTADDTTAPFLSSARPLAGTRVLLRFSKGMSQGGVLPGNVAVADTLSGQRIPVLDISLVPPEGKEAQLVTGPQKQGVGYRVSLAGFADRAGNPMRGAGSTGLFTGSSLADTEKFSIVFRGLEENAFNVPVDDSLRMQFTIPLERSSFASGFSMTDTSRKAVPGRLIWTSSLEVSFLPEAMLPFGRKFLLSVRLDSLRSASGRSLGDSLIVRHFQTVDEKELSSLQGTVLDTVKGATGRIYLTATNISAREAKPRTCVLEAPGDFHMERLMEGKYVLWGFRDQDSSGAYSYGKPFPFRASERFTTYPDTLRLRARWPLEGVVVRFR